MTAAWLPVSGQNAQSSDTADAHKLLCAVSSSLSWAVRRMSLAILQRDAAFSHDTANSSAEHTTKSTAPACQCALVRNWIGNVFGLPSQLASPVAVL